MQLVKFAAAPDVQYVDGDDLFNAVQNRIAQLLITGESPNPTALAVNALYIEALRERAREWESSDLMDMAAWLEGSL